jgi:glutamyl-Q tRNA(Asp) synthetase
LHARQSAGEWLVRVDDIDPPREVPGAADAILRTLESLELHWDREVLFQSQRLAVYAAAAESLLSAGRAFRCTCSRKQIFEHSGANAPYPGTCRQLGLSAPNSAIRVRVDADDVSFPDRLQGPTVRPLSATEGDYVVFRRDGLPAYHLAVVLDDAFQGITDVVRGIDLLDATAVHVHLQGQLDLPTPRYWHLPVVTHADGQKLSKQTGAEGIAPEAARRFAAQTLRLLGLEVPQELIGAPPAELWSWAVVNWRLQNLERVSAIELD